MGLRLRLRRLWTWPLAAGAGDETATGQIEESRERVRRRLSGRDLWVSVAGAVAFFGAAIPLALLSHSERHSDAAVTIALIGAYVIVSQVEFEIGTGSIVPTQLVLVPMLFLLPTGDVPLVVAGALLLHHAIVVGRKQSTAGRVLLIPINAFHALGPAVVLVLAGEGPPELARWPLYIGALVAQFVCDFVGCASRDWLVLGVRPQSDLPVMATVYLVDAALAPVGLLAAIASETWPFAFLFALPLLGILVLFARERRERLNHALELGRAYRGTVFLLGDVIEADDEYTGTHSRDVVALSLAVADELRLSPAERQEVEFTALLHDVGKIRLPAEIINKPGGLTPAERALVEQHTIHGQEMLERVGGLLGRIGRHVRSCHERWDGGGYPDGLAAEQIPLVARIVCCCDAFHAMTSTRPYRAALPLSTALAELRAHSGSQFDPAVVEALASLYERQLERSPEPASLSMAAHAHAAEPA